MKNKLLDDGRVNVVLTHPSIWFIFDENDKMTSFLYA